MCSLVWRSIPVLWELTRSLTMHVWPRRQHSVSCRAKSKRQRWRDAGQPGVGRVAATTARGGIWTDGGRGGGRLRGSKAIFREVSEYVSARSMRRRRPEARRSSRARKDRGGRLRRSRRKMNQQRPVYDVLSNKETSERAIQSWRSTGQMRRFSRAR